jgi:chloramphenicol 3-O phosphotransferase
MKKGMILLLNGVSGSGKTTLAKTLQEQIEEPVFHLSLDAYLAQLHDKHFHEKTVLTREWPTIGRGFHDSVAATARAGNRVIVDHVLQYREWLYDCVRSWNGLSVAFVGVFCPFDVIRQRCEDRGKPVDGWLEQQAERVHCCADYDLRIDTASMMPPYAAELIDGFLESCRPPLAFDRLRRG